MEKVVKEALSLVLGDWLLENRGNSLELFTEDVISTKKIFVGCLEELKISYEMIENKLIIGNKKIYIYKKS